MIIFIFSLLFQAPFSNASVQCDETTQVSKDGVNTDQTVTVDGETYVLRKGPHFCYIDKKVGDSLLMLAGCDRVVANTNSKGSLMLCMQKSSADRGNTLQNVSFSKEALESIYKKKIAQLLKDVCISFLNNEMSSSYVTIINKTADGGRERSQVKTSSLGDIQIRKSEEDGGKCRIRVSGKEQECDELKMVNENLYTCLHGYTKYSVINPLKDSKKIKIEEVTGTKVNLCALKDPQIFDNLHTGVSDKQNSYSLMIKNCQLQDGTYPKCDKIFLDEKIVNESTKGEAKVHFLSCEAQGKTTKLRDIHVYARDEIFKQIFKAESGMITAEKMREFIKKGIIFTADERYADTGRPRIEPPPVKAVHVER